MTSQLRRKHLTTVQKLPRKKAIEDSLGDLKQSFLGTVASWMRASVVAGVAISASSPLNAADFQQRPSSSSYTEPTELLANDEAKPITASRQLSQAESPNAWKLRWRQPPVKHSGRDSAVTQATHSAPTTRSGLTARSASKATLAWSDTTTERSQVRQVAQFTPVDPFESPFGEDPNMDAAVPPSEGTVEVLQPGRPSSPGTIGQPSPGTGPTNPSDAAPLQPAIPSLPGRNPTAPSNDPFGPGRSVPGPGALPPVQPTRPGADRPEMERERNFDVQPSPSDAPRQDDIGPIPGDTTPAPLDDTAPPMPPELKPNVPENQNGIFPNGNGEKQPPCDRVYNRRNCCLEGDNCQAARDRIGQYKITNINLDITPLFTNTDQAITTEEMKLRTLAEVPSRTWMDRQGREIGTGRLTDYQYGRIQITTDEGENIEVPFHNLSDDDLCFVTAWWSLPTECPLGDESFVPRDWLCTNLNWKASALCHKPLYFEEESLERYGHSAGPFKQPFISTAHFFGSLVMLPYQMGMSPPQECEYALGHYRPGSCAPWLVPPFPVSIRGGLAQAGAIVGGVYIIP